MLAFISFLAIAFELHNALLQVYRGEKWSLSLGRC